PLCPYTTLFRSTAPTLYTTAPLGGDSCVAQGRKVVVMFCVTLTVTKNIAHVEAGQIIDQLTESLAVRPDDGGGAVLSFQTIGSRQVQSWLRSADEVVGFILSAARAGVWGVRLALAPDDQVSALDRKSV